MREFYFRPLSEESELGDEADGIEETGAREDDEERLAAKTSSSTSRPRARSIWNVDGELVIHPAIHIKYELLLVLFHSQKRSSSDIEEKSQIPFCRKLKSNQSYMKVLVNSFHLNGHTLGLHPQT